MSSTFIKYRDSWTTTEIQQVSTALDAYVEDTKASPWWQPNCRQYIGELAYHEHVQAALCSGYLILASVGAMYSPRLVLQEIAVIKVQGGNILDVPNALEFMAKELGCYAVVAGDSIGRAGLRGLYLRNGWRLCSTMYMKEV